MFDLIECFFLRFFFGKLTYVLKEEDTKIIRGIPQIYNENRNIKTTDGYRLATEQKTETSLDSLGEPIQPANYQMKILKIRCDY